MKSADAWTAIVVAVLVVLSTASAVAAPGPAGADDGAVSSDSPPTATPPAQNNTSGTATSAAFGDSERGSAAGDATSKQLGDDQFEPNDYRSRATPVEPGDSYENLTVEREDPDYFAFTVSEGDRIDPTVTAQSYGLDQRLLGPDGDRVADTGYYGVDSIDYEARESGTYYLAVTTDSYAAIRYNITYGG